MLLRNYLNSLHKEIEKLENYGFIESVEVKEEIRAIKQALFTARVVFINGSELHIKEYIDARYKIERVSYAYHYQDRDGNCIFRYDDAVHKPALRSREHKHTLDGSSVPSDLPDISEIFDEIIGSL
ncbi:MAG: DUF6516 family protein [Candidatus Aminicenantes bacterium]|nr:DUF6516 family protein [Candidatus Aminicenantes bacterium]